MSSSDMSACPLRCYQPAAKRLTMLYKDFLAGRSLKSMELRHLAEPVSYSLRCLLHLPRKKSARSLIVMTRLIFHRPQTPASISIDCSGRSEEHTSELQSQSNLVCRLLLEKKNTHGVQTM